ncbi:MAG: PrpR N-terminal domain-containing protein [Eubacteriales bacterium]|nr:PrpR N-terminal domain-containing protein [Eubacteriales bacterium]
MGKTALLVSREEMLHQAHNILQEKSFQIHEMRVISTEHAVTEARRSIADGASIIIARGLQASLIKQYTDIPVVEIVMTAQEMALLVTRAKQIVSADRPVIAVVGFENMFCDMSYFDELYGIELRTYYARRGAELPEAVRRAVEDGVDLVIGGDTAVTAAGKAGVASLFLSTTEDSMRQAISMAASLEYAMNVEKKTAAQMETLLDYSFSGVIRLDGAGLVTAVNPMMEDIIGKSQKELKGLPVRMLAPLMGEDILNRVLKDGKDYSLFLEWNHTPVFAVIAPVLYENRVDGAIITCHRTRRMAADTKAKEEGGGRRSPSGALPPLVRFEDILQHSEAMQECVRMASLYALSQRPVVLLGEPGTEKRMLAESIHNSSSRRNGPFLDVPCEGLSGEEQRNMIFGERGAVLQAQGGTLLIRDVEELTAANQYRLYQLIRFKVCHGTDIARFRKVDLRVMATVQKPLSCLMAEGRISQDLYYLLSGLELSVPPFRERREDLEWKISDAVRDCCERYGRYHVLTAGAKAVLMDYPWRGNLFQIESFCERLILTAGKRSIDEIAVRGLLEELYPEQSKEAADREAEAGNGGGGVPPEPREAVRIRQALAEWSGSRERTAEALGISKATLWRKMKKYGIR